MHRFWPLLHCLLRHSIPGLPVWKVRPLKAGMKTTCKFASFRGSIRYLTAVCERYKWTRLFYNVSDALILQVLKPLSLCPSNNFFRCFYFLFCTNTGLPGCIRGVTTTGCWPRERESDHVLHSTGSLWKAQVDADRLFHLWCTGFGEGLAPFTLPFKANLFPARSQLAMLYERYQHGMVDKVSLWICQLPR